MQSWQVFSYARKILSPGFLQGLYRRSVPLIYSWAASPLNERHDRNPIDRITAMLAELDMRGRGDVSRAAIDIMAKPLGGCFAYFEDAESDKGNIDGEVADVAVALGRLAETCRTAMADGEVNAEERGDILESMRKVYLELGQIMAKARQALRPRAEHGNC